MLRYRAWSLIAAGAALLVPAVAMAAIVRLPTQIIHSPSRPAATSHGFARHKAGLGKILMTADGGQIFGWDINETGDDGVLASGQTVDSGGDMRVSVETFDQNTGKITKSLRRYVGKKHSYFMAGILAGDVALVTHFVTHKDIFFPHRDYDVMNPVANKAFTGQWTPPVPEEDVQSTAENQTTSTSLVYAFELKNNDIPDLIVSDVATNTFGRLIHLDPTIFNLQNGTQLAQDTATNQAVLAASFNGAPGGQPPIMGLVDLKTGKVKTFQGLNGGPFGSGFVNGLAVDSNTGIAATTTELNAQVEFTNLATQVAIGVQLPNTGPTDQLLTGAAVANDSVNKLFLVAQPVSSTAPSGSSIHVFDESGNLLESINGLNFSNRFSVVPVRIAINPSKRMGWVDGSDGLSGPANNLQQFFY